MYDISLSEEELEMLEALLRREIDNASVELHRTDRRGFKHIVEHRLHILEGLLMSLKRCHGEVPIT